MPQRNNDARSNRRRSHPNSNSNSTCNYRLMYILGRNPSLTVSRSNNTNTSRSTNSSTRRTRSGAQRQLNISNPIISARPRLCALSETRNYSLRANFFLRIENDANGTSSRIVIQPLENQIVTHSQIRTRNSGRRNSSRNNVLNNGREYNIFPFNREVHIPWPNMNPVHNFRRASAARTENSSNNTTPAETRPLRRRLFRGFMPSNLNSNSSTSSNRRRSRYIHNRSGSLSSVESDRSSRKSEASNNSNLSVNALPLDERNECLVCLCNPSEYILVNCGHICLCGDCVIRFRRQRYAGDDRPSTRCPLCRAPILSTPRRC